nr:HAD hydrolase family protein [Entomoplasma sp. MP1]
MQHFNEIKAKIGNEYRIDNYHNRVISIAPKDIDKGYAVEVINKYLNNTGQFDTYGFGDSYNDFALIAAVDFWYCYEKWARRVKRKCLWYNWIS